MKSKLIRRSGLILAVLIIMGSAVELVAQCPMCSMAVESNLADGGTTGRGLNSGIFYILVAPYILAGILGYLWWKRSEKLKAVEDAADMNL